MPCEVHGVKEIQDIAETTIPKVGQQPLSLGQECHEDNPKSGEKSELKLTHITGCKIPNSTSCGHAMQKNSNTQYLYKQA